MKRLTFIVFGNGVSGNHYKQPMATSVYRGRQYVTSAAATFKSTAYGEAFLAVEAQKWTRPAFVRVDVSVYNMRMDRDNAVKVLYDALAGVCYYRDSRILDGGIRLIKDRGEPRYVISVTEVDPRSYGRNVRKKDNPPLTHEQWVDSMTQI